MEHAILQFDRDNNAFLDMIQTCGGSKTVEADHFDHVSQIIAVVVPATAILAQVLREYIREKIRADRDIEVAKNSNKSDVVITIGEVSMSVLKADEATLNKLLSRLEN